MIRQHREVQSVTMPLHSKETWFWVIGVVGICANTKYIFKSLSDSGTSMMLDASVPQTTV